IEHRGRADGIRMRHRPVDACRSYERLSPAEAKADQGESRLQRPGVDCARSAHWVFAGGLFAVGSALDRLGTGTCCWFCTSSSSASCLMPHAQVSVMVSTSAPILQFWANTRPPNAH